MKISLSFVAVLLTLCKADKASPESRSLGRQPGGRKPSADKLQSMIDAECTNFDCDATDSIDCTFDKPDSELPDTEGFDEDKIAQLKTGFSAKKEERKQKMLKCACCDNMSVEDILAAKGKNGGSRVDKLQSMIDAECTNFDCDATDGIDCTFEKPDPELPDTRGFDEEKIAQLKADFSAKKEERKQKMLKCACCENMSVEEILAAKGNNGGSRPFGQGSGRPGRPGDGYGRPGMGGSGFGGLGRPGNGGGIQQMLEEKCPEFMPKCAAMEDDDIDCDKFESMVGASTRGGLRRRRRRKAILYCGCCPRD